MCVLREWSAFSDGKRQGLQVTRTHVLAWYLHPDNVLERSTLQEWLEGQGQCNAEYFLGSEAAEEIRQCVAALAELQRGNAAEQQRKQEQ